MIFFGLAFMSVLALVGIGMIGGFWSHNSGLLRWAYHEAINPRSRDGILSSVKNVPLGCDAQRDRLTKISSGNYFSFTPHVFDTRITPNILNLRSSMSLEKRIRFFEAAADELFTTKEEHVVFLTADFNNDLRDDVLMYTPTQIENTRYGLFFGTEGGFRHSKSFDENHETCVAETGNVADYNNDGYTDIFLPCITSNDTETFTQLGQGESHSQLFLNNGDETFTESSKINRIGMRYIPFTSHPVGAQSVDINHDGLIDIYTAGRMYMNEGGHFSNQLDKYNLRADRDEGLKFTDTDLDGDLDLITYLPYQGPAVQIREGDEFSIDRCYSPLFGWHQQAGINTADINGDFFSDILLKSTENINVPPPVLIGQEGGFSAYLPDWWVGEPLFERRSIDNRTSIAWGDYDNNGTVDLASLAYTENPDGTLEHELQVYINDASPRTTYFYVELLSKEGFPNQHGRTIVIDLPDETGRRKAIAVDSGSGYFNQSPYPILVQSPVKGEHTGEAYFADTIVPFTVRSGDYLKVYEDGRIERFDHDESIGFRLWLN